MVIIYKNRRYIVLIYVLIQTKILQNILYCMGTNNYLHLNIKPVCHQKNSFEKRLKFRRDFIIYRKKTKNIKIYKIRVEEGVSHRNVSCVFFCLERKLFTVVCIIRLEKNTRSSVQRKRRMRTVQWS